MGNKTTINFCIIFILIGFYIYAGGKKGKVESPEPKLYLEGHGVDLDYLRTEIPYIDYVRDRNDANVHLQILSQRTGSNGREYKLYFFGRGIFKGNDRIVICRTGSDDSYETIRSKLTRTIQLALLNYLINSDVIENFSLSYRQKNDQTKTAVADPWNHWLFNSSINTAISGDENYKSQHFSSSLRASRVTEKMKLRLGIYYRSNKNSYDLDGDTYSDEQTSWNFSSIYIKSLGTHLSMGGYIGMQSSTFSNQKFLLKLSLALEYNIFPYKDAARKEFLFNYTIGQKRISYRELTIYDKMKESRLYHNLFILYSQQTKWGSFFCSLAGSQYFFDLKKHQLRFYSRLSLKLFKGFSLHLYGRYSIIHDQLSIIKGEISTEEVLLRQRELTTGYSYRVSIGIGYSFGSIYNNVVNPRFDHW